jgi:hypothetical protein
MPKMLRLKCLACGRDDDGRRGWGGYRIDSEPEDRPQVAFLCPECVEQEMGTSDAA